MSDATKLIIIRHGETVDNAARRAQGQLPGKLNERGIAQAQATARRLQEVAISAIYSSDSERAYHTARIIATATGNDIVLDERLRERHYGVFQGHLHADLEILYPDIMKKRRSWDPDYAIPGGESARDIYRRVVACTEEVAERHPGETVVITTHGGALGVLFRHVLGIPLDQPRRFWVRNASLNVFSCDLGEWRLERWGDVNHLQELDGYGL
jgi:2,3-bisphosphoglycerate-dependent phosphoglycerate mutase